MNKKIILLACLVMISACAPRRDDLCEGSTLKLCEPSIYFEFDSSKVNPANKENLIWVKQKLDRWPNKVVLLTGHTDLVGENTYNRNLSGRRAISVGDELVRLGVNPEQIKVSAMGSTRPLTNEKDTQYKNRRVDIVFGTKPNAIERFFGMFGL